MEARALFTSAYLFACEVQQNLRGRRKKYLKRAWKVAHHLPHWPDGASRGVALCMLVLLVLSAARPRKGG